MTKTLICICLLGPFSYLLSLSCQAQEKAVGQGPQQVVTSRQLQIEDVKRAATECLASQECILGRVMGIYQEGGSARVYVRYSNKAKKQDVTVVDLVRFNSGKWYNLTSKDYLRK